jgi:hypothetical protein
MLLFGTICSLSAQTEGIRINIVVNNPLGVDRTDELVGISWASILSKNPAIDTANFKVVNTSTNQEVPFQLEYAGQQAIQNLLLQVSVEANASIQLSVVAGKPEAIINKTFGRYVPERYDDFAWENDKVAYRMYGKALETRSDNAFGIDVWVKRTDKLVINDWYKTGDYHKDHGDGMDYYSVGLTLGAGDIAPYHMDSIYFSKNYHSWKVLDNGPLRTSFQLSYDAWDVAGKSVRVVKSISLDAGSHFNKIQAAYNYLGEGDLPVVIGIVKRKEPGVVMMDEQVGIMGYWEPEHGADGITGVATIFPTGAAKMSADKVHLLTHALVKGNEPLVYFNGSVWNKANDIAAGTTAEQWFKYLYLFNQKVNQPLKVTIQ